MWTAVAAAPPLVLWLWFLRTVWRLRRRGRLRLHRGGLPVAIGVGLLANAPTVAAVFGHPVPAWLLLTFAAAACMLGCGYMLAMRHRWRAVIDGPWPADPATVRRDEARQAHKERIRAIVAQLDEQNMTESDRAGVDAPRRDEENR